MKEFGLELNEEWHLEDRVTEQEFPICKLPDELPQAFVCCSDYSAGFLFEELKSIGMSVPEDIRIASYDDYFYNKKLKGKITTYHVDMLQMARSAISILDKKVRFSDSFRGVRYVDGWITGYGIG